MKTIDDPFTIENFERVFGSIETKREYFRDETGRFATSGAAGAANAAMTAIKDAQVATSEVGKGGSSFPALANRVRTGAEKAHALARESLGQDHPATRAARAAVEEVSRANRSAESDPRAAKDGYERAVRRLNEVTTAIAEIEGNKSAKTEGEYIRDERGPFATTGAAGAANSATQVARRTDTYARSFFEGASNEQAVELMDSVRTYSDKTRDLARQFGTPETVEKVNRAADAIEGIEGRIREGADPSSVGRELMDAGRLMEEAADELAQQSERTMERRGRHPEMPPTEEEIRRHVEGRIGRPKSMKSIEDEMTKERADVEFAFARGSIEDLPAPAQAIWKRMHDSAAKIYQGPNAERYATAIAWRAIREKYAIASDADAVDSRPAGVSPSEPLTRRLISSAKTFLGGVVTGIEGGYYVVPITAFRDVERKYEAIELIDIPLTNAKVRVGISVNNHRNIIDVRVPQADVSKQLAGNGAVTWVRQHWDRIFNIAKFTDEYSPDRGAKSEPFPFVTASKFVRSAERAKHHIVYGPIYTPWKVDLQGQYATDEDVMKMAHSFMAKRKMGQMHGQWMLPDGRPVGDLVESFTVRRGDPDFPDEGAWIGGTKCHDEVWQKVLSGELVGYSIGGNWGARQIVLRR